MDEYARLKLQVEELHSRAEAVADQLKDMMTGKGINEMSAGTHNQHFPKVNARKRPILKTQTA